MLKNIFITIAFMMAFIQNVNAADTMDFADLSGFGGAGFMQTSLTSSEVQSYTTKAGMKIISNFEMPKTAENYSTVVLFKINSSGQISKYEIVQKSGNQDYDNRVISALKKSAPFPSPKFEHSGDVEMILNMDLSIIKLIKMISENADLNELLNPSAEAVPPTPQVQPKSKQTPKPQTPTGKRFVNPYEY